jgi:hypothetical protein
MARLALTYVLPLRWDQDDGLDELRAYLREVVGHVMEVIVVDGSDPRLFDSHAEAFGPAIRHLRPHSSLRFAMGKVNGVATGVREARCEHVVVADDDVRYSPAALARAGALLEEADLVRPQNYFEPLVWHARWDTARTLLNRAFSGDPHDWAGDFPGTLAVRRSSFLRMGGYDGDALFENLELIRTVRAAGGSVASPLDLYVARRPPTAAHFRSQRVRQAYDDFALPLRMAAWLSTGPALVLAARRRRPGSVALGAGAAVLLAEAGRRRAGGARFFPASSSLLAPAWILERAVTSWLAVLDRARGGARYGDGRLRLAANRERDLRRRYEERPLEPAVAGDRSADGALSAANSTSL